ncbi:MAG: THUMP domain-containing protein [Bacteroidota bacterium]|nr:THUMP domain-containing protein [Bacteroidota bacterium]
MDADFKMTAQTMFGLEQVLARELLKLGAKNIEVHNRAVSFNGDLGFMYKANFCLRTALRVLVPINSFEIHSQLDLYDGIRAMEWDHFMDPKDTLAISCTLNTEHFDHSQFVSQRAKDAIVDRFRDKYGERPSVDLDQPTLGIHLYLDHDMCTVSLDSSGGSLHKRGYRDKTNLAPMNEVLAAGLVLLSGWDRRSNFVDPMCGSGTLLIEAALYAANIPPGYYRSQFGFMRWADFDEDLWAKIQEAAIARINEEKPVILGGEISRNVARKAVTNIHSAKLEDSITMKHSAFEDLEPPPGPGVLILNPPYGERMDKDEDINALYKMIGDTFKKKWAGYNAWVMTSNLEAAKHIHLTPKPRIKLYNGPLECRFLRYELYSGTRKTERTAAEN